MRISSLAVIPVVAVTVVGLTAPSHAAGRAEQGPANSKSLCSFSGLNDDPSEAFPDDGRTQSYGQLVKKGVIVPRHVRSGEPSPGTMCNPNNIALK